MRRLSLPFPSTAASRLCAPDRFRFTIFNMMVGLLTTTILPLTGVPVNAQETTQDGIQNKVQKRSKKQNARQTADATADAKNTSTGLPDPPRDPELASFGIYENTAPRATSTAPVITRLPLELQPGDRIALIGNALLERSGQFGNLEAMIQQTFPEKKVTLRHLAWTADEVDAQPRPDNFADTFQHLTHEKADVIFAAYGFNESFAGDEGLESFRQSLTRFVSELKTKAFNGHSAPRIVLVSPIANENLPSVAAADLNNDAIKRYVDVMREVAVQQNVAFADVFRETSEQFKSLGSDYTINGIHLNQDGDRFFSKTLFETVFRVQAPEVLPELAELIADKNRQFFRRFRPLNTF
ncbi:MAG: SGNH/GDSL hydrolase family protein, partial [Planctomycetales bacterium]|nr:SGNH/GDSL hydrolase family protein [Planctomycetales bacterium]